MEKPENNNYEIKKVIEMLGEGFGIPAVPSFKNKTKITFRMKNRENPNEKPTVISPFDFDDKKWDQLEILNRMRSSLLNTWK